MSGVQVVIVLHLVSVALVALPVLRACPYYLDLFKMRNLQYETASMQELLHHVKWELRHRAVIPDLLDYLFIVFGSAIAGLAHLFHLMYHA
jgi:hypothetical protein